MMDNNKTVINSGAGDDARKRHEQSKRITEKEIKTKAVLGKTEVIYSEWYTRLRFITNAKDLYSKREYEEAAAKILTVLDASKIEAIKRMLNNEKSCASRATKGLITNAIRILIKGEMAYAESIKLYKLKDYKLSCEVIFRYFNNKDLIIITEAIHALIVDISKEIHHINDVLGQLKNKVGDMHIEISRSDGFNI